MLSKKDYESLFPTLKREINGNKIIYLDSAATSLKPHSVLEAMDDYYANHNANVHRATYTLAAEATMAYENARDNIAEYINSKSKEVIFTKGTTEALNLLAYSFANSNIFGGNDEILLTTIEHHANFVPWQQIAKMSNIKVVYYRPENGIFNFEEYIKLINKNTKVISITGLSNVTGQIIPVKEIVRKFREVRPDGYFVLDGAQLVPHFKVDVKELDVDFMAFSGHKMFGPMGIGVLYGKAKALNGLTPFLYGGEMIDKVSVEETTFNTIPYKFEAGTPNVGGAVGLSKAIDFIKGIGIDKISEHSKMLTDYAIKKLSEIELVEIYGTKDDKHTSIISFNIGEIHPHDVAHLLDQQFGISVRSGHHCAQPLLKELNIKAACRASFYIYNTKDDVDRLVEGVRKIKEMLV